MCFMSGRENRISARDMRCRLLAGQSLRAIASDIGVSPSTVLRWKRELGLGELSAESFMEHDSPEQIQLCLNCSMPVCRGECQSVKSIRS